MKFAIDRYITGLEKEVCADDFYGKYIPRKSNRFYCPECGLQVYWVSKGGNQPNKFKHPPRTETSPECDKRVDGRSDLYLYERVGLPVFLSRLAGNNFQLSISFPAVGSKMLANGAAQSARVIIRGNGNNRTVLINTNNFYPDRATLIPVNFLPSDNGVFRIEVSPGSAYSRKWSNYAEGFTSTGAIFTYDESGGKKVHRDDSISPGRQYYVVASQFSCPFSEIHYNAVGTLKLQNRNYQVYCMTVNVSLQNERRYSQISDFFRYRFGVGLLVTAPEIIPLWPPVIEQDVLIPAKDSRIFCTITSGNDDPSVYSYVGNQVLNIPVQKDRNGEKHIYVKAGTIDTVMSVDRKYVGREIVFRTKMPAFSTATYDLCIHSHHGNTILPGEIAHGDLTEGGILTSNSKFDLFLGSVDHSFLRIPIRTNETLLPTISNLNILLAAVEGGVFYSQSVNTPAFVTQAELDIQSLAQQFRGEYIPVPRWVCTLLNDLTKKGLTPAVQVIVGHISNGKLPVGAIKALHTLYRMNGGA